MKQFVHVIYEECVEKGFESPYVSPNHVLSKSNTALVELLFFLLPSGCHENHIRESVTTSVTAQSGYTIAPQDTFHVLGY